MARPLRALVSTSPLLAALALVAALPSCGAKTGLVLPEAAPDTAVADTARDTADASDAEDTLDAPDSTSTIDVLPPIDSPPFCKDPTVLLVYVVTESNELLSFEPPSATFRSIGTINCPASGGATPFSMAVDHTGIAYVVFSDGELFRVNVKDASCKATSYTSPGGAFTTFGMGFVRDPTGTAETLYVATTGTPSTLAKIDTATMKIASVATLDPEVLSAELTGTGAGQLFGFFQNRAAGDGSSSIAEIDKTTGAIAGRADLPTVSQGSGWAFAFWGGDFYTFTAPASVGHTIVQRYRPGDGSVVQVQELNSIVVGAGVSTCAPG